MSPIPQLSPSLENNSSSSSSYLGALHWSSSAKCLVRFCHQQMHFTRLQNSAATEMSRRYFFWEGCKEVCFFNQQIWGHLQPIWVFLWIQRICLCVCVCHSWPRAGWWHHSPEEHVAVARDLIRSSVFERLKACPEKKKKCDKVIAMLECCQNVWLGAMCGKGGWG